MPIKGAVIKEGATPAFTGGTDKTYSEMTSTGPGVLTADLSVADFRVRPNTVHTSKLPVLDAKTGVYSKGRASATHRRPKVCSDGITRFPLARVEVEFLAENSAAEIQAFWDWIAQLATDSDYANFRATGSLS